MYSVSVSLTVDGWDLAALLIVALSSRTTFAASTVGAVRCGGPASGLLPTYDAPHYDPLLGSAEYREAEALLAVFGPPEANPYKRRGR